LYGGFLVPGNIFYLNGSNKKNIQVKIICHQSKKYFSPCKKKKLKKEFFFLLAATINRLA